MKSPESLLLIEGLVVDLCFVDDFQVAIGGLSVGFYLAALPRVLF